MTIRFQFAHPWLRRTPLPFRTGRWKCWEPRSRYMPHQGTKEMARRKARMEPHAAA